MRRRSDELMNLYTNTLREEFSDLTSDMVDVNNQLNELKTTGGQTQDDVKVNIDG